MSLQHYPAQEGFEELLVGHQARIRQTIAEAHQARLAQRAGDAHGARDRWRTRWEMIVALPVHGVRALGRRTLAAFGRSSAAVAARSRGYRL